MKNRDEILLYNIIANLLVRDLTKSIFDNEIPPTDQIDTQGHARRDTLTELLNIQEDDLNDKNVKFVSNINSYLYSIVISKLNRIFFKTYTKKVPLIESVDEKFYESVSNVTIAISQIFVKYVDITEKCINRIKHLKTLDLVKWKEKQYEENHARKEEAIIRLESDHQNFSPTCQINSIKPLHTNSDYLKHRKLRPTEKRLSNYFLILSNLPHDVTRIEIIKLSKDIHKLYINHEIDKNGVLVKR